MDIFVQKKNPEENNKKSRFFYVVKMEKKYPEKNQEKNPKKYPVFLEDMGICLRYF